jgi:1-phosphofructokinase family hexose kinase
VARVPSTLQLAGGKGFNAARALRVFGQQPLVVGPMGGFTGRKLAELAATDGISCAPVGIAGETRTCLTIVDAPAGCITELYEAGPALEPAEWSGLLNTTKRQLERTSWLIISGSCPPGVPENGLREVVEHARLHGVPALLDTYGAQMKRALEATPDLVKINQDEAADLLGIAVEGVDGGIMAAAGVRYRGARAAVITLGKLGAVGIDSAGQPLGWAAPDVAGTFPTGSGDSLFGGLVAGLAHGFSLREALRLGVAAGAANTLQVGAGVFDRHQVEMLLPEVKLLDLEP